MITRGGGAVPFASLPLAANIALSLAALSLAASVADDDPTPSLDPFDSLDGMSHLLFRLKNI